MPTPEEFARQNIDKLLTQCGWTIQKRSEINLSAGHGIVIREGLLKGGDEVDYLLFVDGKAVGTVEAKPEGYTLTGVEEQSGKYGKGLLDIYLAWQKPAPVRLRTSRSGRSREALRRQNAGDDSRTFWVKRPVGKSLSGVRRSRGTADGGAEYCVSRLTRQKDEGKRQNKSRTKPNFCLYPFAS